MLKVIFFIQLLFVLCSTKESYYFDPEANKVVDEFRKFSNQEHKPPVVFIPGLIGSRMIAWKKKQCFGSNIDIQDIVWFNLQKLLETLTYDKSCWLDCMKLNTSDSSTTFDPHDCTLRAEEGLASIGELSPGNIFTPPATSVFTTFIRFFAEELHYDSNAMIAIPYDWRLSPKQLLIRDNFFVLLQRKIELLVQQHQYPVIVIAHSMGNNLFQYFLEWMRVTSNNERKVETWIEKHVYLYLGYAAPLLGASSTLKAILSGHTFGLPLPEYQVKALMDTFPSTHFLLPRSPKHLSPVNTSVAAISSSSLAIVASEMKELSIVKEALGVSVTEEENINKEYEPTSSSSIATTSQQPKKKLITSFPASSIRKASESAKKNMHMMSSKKEAAGRNEEEATDDELANLKVMELNVFGDKEEESTTPPVPPKETTRNTTIVDESTENPMEKKRKKKKKTNTIDKKNVYAQTHWSTDFFAIPLLTIEHHTISSTSSTTKEATSSQPSKDTDTSAQDSSETGAGEALPPTIQITQTTHNTYEFTIRDLEDKAFWKTMLGLLPDETSLHTKYAQYQRWYEEDSIQPLIHAYHRPPIKHVYMIYGIDLPTELQFVYSITNMTTNPTSANVSDASTTANTTNTSSTNKEDNTSPSKQPPNEFVLQEVLMEESHCSALLYQGQFHPKHKKKTQNTSVEVSVCPTTTTTATAIASSSSSTTSEYDAWTCPSATTETVKSTTESEEEEEEAIVPYECHAGIYRVPQQHSSSSSSSSAAGKNPQPRRTYAHKSTYAHSGDNTVPYYSLSYAHTWLYHNRFSSSTSSKHSKESSNHTILFPCEGRQAIKQQVNAENEPHRWLLTPSREIVLHEDTLCIWKEFHPPQYEQQNNPLLNITDNPLVVLASEMLGTTAADGKKKLNFLFQSIQNHTTVLTNHLLEAIVTNMPAMLNITENMMLPKEEDIDEGKGTVKEEQSQSSTSAATNKRNAGTRPSSSPTSTTQQPSSKKGKEILHALNIYHSEDAMNGQTTTIFEVAQVDHLEVLKYKPLFYEVFNRILPTMKKELHLFESVDQPKN